MDGLCNPLEGVLVDGLCNPLCVQVDGLSDDRKIEAQRDIHQRATDDLSDAGLDGIHLSFYLTSIYDHSIFEASPTQFNLFLIVILTPSVQAFSRVVQKLIPQLPTLENLLNILISVSPTDSTYLITRL